VDEQIPAAVIGYDEAIAPHGIEPFYATTQHCHLFRDVTTNEGSVLRRGGIGVASAPGK
jgi:hypothetical protein